MPCVHGMHAVAAGPAVEREIYFPSPSRAVAAALDYFVCVVCAEKKQVLPLLFESAD